jgi:hypothetical protein
VFAHVLYIPPQALSRWYSDLFASSIWLSEPVIAPQENNGRMDEEGFSINTPGSNSVVRSNKAIN